MDLDCTETAVRRSVRPCNVRRDTADVPSRPSLIVEARVGRACAREHDMRHGWLGRMVVAGGLVMATAGAAGAQAAGERGYVAGVVFADVVRSSGPQDEVRILYGAPPSTTTPGGAVRAGVALGPQWGVEAEVAVSATATWEPGYPYVLASELFPGLEVYTGEAERRIVTTSALAWVRKPLGDRVSLVVLGGVSFARTSQSRVYSTPLAARLPEDALSLIAPDRFVYYDVGPAVGVDVPIRITERLDAIGGLRAHSVRGGVSGWLIRPSGGLRWRF
jgi:hypothetical protein